MSSSIFKIIRQCRMCGNTFEAQKITTGYCSNRCSSAHYKLRKRLERKETAEKPVKLPELFKPRVKALNRAIIKEKDFLTVKEISVLFECSTKTIYSLIRSKKIKATNLGKRKTYVKRSNIDKLFE